MKYQAILSGSAHSPPRILAQSTTEHTMEEALWKLLKLTALLISMRRDRMLQEIEKKNVWSAFNGEVDESMLG